MKEKAINVKVWIAHGFDNKQYCTIVLVKEAHEVDIVKNIINEYITKSTIPIVVQVLEPVELQ